MMKQKKQLVVAVSLLLGVFFFCDGATGSSLKLAAPAYPGAVKMEVALGSGAVFAGKKEKVLIKVGMTGDIVKDKLKRPPVNVSIVVDRSGSMAGEKMDKAKEAALLALDRLEPEDIFSLVAYNHTVDVLVPATKVSDRAAIRNAILSLTADGYTALFAGVSKGVSEVRKFLDTERVSRVVLISDGMANVGPSSPVALGDFGASLMKEGISVTTVGLGMDYNEDLMVALASRSDGNHAFAETGLDLARIFDNELNDLLSVAARDVVVEIVLKGGAKPICSLGRNAVVTGNKVVSRLNQVYSSQEKFVLLEVEVPASFSGDLKEIASVNLSYRDMFINLPVSKSDVVKLLYSDSLVVVEASQNNAVLIAGAELKANEQNKVAVDLMDKGKLEEAAKLLEKNAAELDLFSEKYKSPALKKRAMSNRADSKKVKSPAAGPKLRKEMRRDQYSQDMQMKW